MSNPGVTKSKGQEMTSATLLRAASELIGSNKVLAERLGTTQSLLIKYMTGRDEDVPRDIVLKAIDLLMEERAAQSDTLPPS
jgi:hypothetical protein